MLGDCYFQGWNPSEELKISWILWEVHVFPCGPHEKTSPAMENPEMTFFSKGGLGNAIAVSHIQLPGWFKAKRPDGKHGDRPKYGRLISQRFRRQVMKTFPWGCSRRNWGYNQYKIGDIHLKFAVSYLCFDGDRESGSKLLSSLILLNMIGDFPNRKSTVCGIYRNMFFVVFVGVPYADSSRGFKGLSCPWVGDAQWFLFFPRGLRHQFGGWTMPLVRNSWGKSTSRNRQGQASREEWKTIPVSYNPMTGRITSH